MTVDQNYSKFKTLEEYGIRGMWEFRGKFYRSGRWQLKSYKEFVKTLKQGDILPFLEESLDVLNYYCSYGKEAERLRESITFLINKEPKKIRVSIIDFDLFIEKMKDLNKTCLHKSNAALATFISKNFDTGYAESTIKRRLGE